MIKRQKEKERKENEKKKQLALISVQAIGLTKRQNPFQQLNEMNRGGIK